MIDCLVKLNITKIESMLTLKCLGELISIILKFTGEKNSIIGSLPRGDIMKRLIDYIEMICELSIKNEQNRGESWEQVILRID